MGPFQLLGIIGTTQFLGLIPFSWGFSFKFKGQDSYHLYGNLGSPIDKINSQVSCQIWLSSNSVQLGLWEVARLQETIIVKFHKNANMQTKAN